MVNETFSKTEGKMKGMLKGFKDDLAALRTGRASPALVEHIKVDYAGIPTPLIQLASISAPESRLLIIQPWDKGSIINIEKAILKSELGLNPANDGTIIRIRIPPLSEERREEMIKIVRRRIEERRVAVRNLRRDALTELKRLEKDKEISQDEERRAQDQLQKLTDRYIADVEQTGRDKEKELMEV